VKLSLPVEYPELALALLTTTDFANALQRELAKRGSEALLPLSPARVRAISGRTQLRSAVLDSVARILHARRIYFLRSQELFLLAPFGALSKSRAASRSKRATESLRPQAAWPFPDVKRKRIASRSRAAA
jgi:hypothetical protein